MMILESKDFKNNDLLDKKFTCDGEDFSPHLRWHNDPKGTKSFAITFTRPDPEIGEISHWYIYNIPLNVNEIQQDGITPGIEVENDFFTLNYEGPNATDGIKKYIFRIYALDTEKLVGLQNQNFRKTIRQHTIEYSELVAFYERTSIPKSSNSCNGCSTSSQSFNL